jgi:hypothetical protein
VDSVELDRNQPSGPKLEDCAMAVAGQRSYRDDALRLGNRKQFYGICVKPKELLRINSANKQKFQFWFEKQADPVYVLVAQLDRARAYEA